ncbi:unnamed protein product [Microthlaspi erraticum]|nr:unnamed protein product [Microthlaspi erraticum]
MMDDAQRTDTPIEPDEANPSNMQPTSCAATNANDGWDNKIDRRYMMLLDSFREDGDSYPRVRDNPLRCIRYDVDNGGYDKREFKAVTDEKKKRRSREEDRNTVRVNVTKKKNVVESKHRHVQASSKKTAKEAVVSDKRRREKSVDGVGRNSQEARKEKHSEGEMVPDENYRAYLAWLVEKSRIRRANAEKEIQVKREVEDDTMSLSGSDIIAVGDRPFEDEEESPFVASKSYKVTDLEEESDEDDDDQRSSWFRKEITSILKKPYNEKELLELKKQAAERRSLIRCRELRDGREIDYETDEKGRSYLDKYPNFKTMLKEALRDKDHHRALNLLRGFIFYLEKMVRHDAFKPWRDRECLKIT